MSIERLLYAQAVTTVLSGIALGSSIAVHIAGETGGALEAGHGVFIAIWPTVYTALGAGTVAAARSYRRGDANATLAVAIASLFGFGTFAAPIALWTLIRLAQAPTPGRASR